MGKQLLQTHGSFKEMSGVGRLKSRLHLRHLRQLGQQTNFRGHERVPAATVPSAGKFRFGNIWAEVVKTVVVDPILVGEFTSHFRLPNLVGIESDVHWGYDLACDPRQHMATSFF